jgi:hypothetical protein
MEIFSTVSKDTNIDKIESLFLPAKLGIQSSDSTTINIFYS